MPTFTPQTIPLVTNPTKFISINSVTQFTETSLEIVQVRVTSAQLLALHTTAVAIIPPASSVPNVLGTPNFVNSNETIWLENVLMKYTFGTVAYTTTGGTLRLFYGPSTNAHPLIADVSAGFINATASRIIGFVPLLINGPDTIVNMTGQGIFLFNDGTANYTLGDGVLDVTIVYGRTTP